MAVVIFCTACGREYPWAEPRWRCDCGGLLESRADTPFEPAAVTAEPSLWRYAHVLPVEPVAGLGEGWTPLVRGELAGHAVWLKLDYLNPSGSFKDRGAAVLTARLARAGVAEVVEDSSGNAGAALALYAARARIRCTIYCPASASAAKTAMMTALGARVVRVPGSREDTAEAVRKAAEQSYYASHVYDPAYLEGTQTLAFELVEQLRWRAPEVVVVPVGNGTLLLGLDKGFGRLCASGVIDRMPRLIAACAAQRPTVAEGVAVVDPPRRAAIEAAVNRSGGQLVTVYDEAVVSSLRRMVHNGWYIEPTAAVATAAWEQWAAENRLKASEPVVVVLTGSGLKTAETIVELLTCPA